MAGYRLVIVDDERPIVEGLKAFIPWEEEGFTVAGTAYNGETGVETALEVNADVVLTDIRMPLLSGHGLIQRVKANNPDCAFIVLSGYSNFEYARDAVNSGASCYLLKPVQEDELRQCLRRIKKQLDEKKSSQREISRLRERLDQVSLLVAEHSLYEIVASKRYSTEQISEKWAALNTGYRLDRFALIVTEPDALERMYHDDSDNMVYTDYRVTRIITDYAANNRLGVTFRSPKDQTVVICCPEDGKRLTVPFLKKVAKELRQAVESATGVTVSSGISPVYETTEKLHEAYKLAQKALEYKLLYGPGSLICHDELAPENGGSLYPVLAEKEMLDCIEMGDRNSAKNKLTEIFQHIRSREGASPALVYAVCTGLTISILHRAVMCGVSMEKLQEKQRISPDRISELKSVSELEEMISSLTDCAIGQIREMRAKQQKGVIGEIQQYVEEHYQENISLDFIEEKFFINASYLSYLFKKKVGENFIDYLTDIRIENAKKLLTKSELKVYEVGTAVGYGSSRYFSQIFEKKVGMTPTEYRQRTREK